MCGFKTNLHCCVAPIHKAYGSTSDGTAGVAAFRIQDGQPKLLWKNGDWCQSPAIWIDCVFGFDERSTFWCIDLHTGKELWPTKNFGSSGKSGGGLMIVGGKALTIDARQTLTIAEVSAKSHEPIRGLLLPVGLRVETAPLLLGGRFYCRNHPQLI